MYVALILPCLLKTRHMYSPLSSSCTLTNLRTQARLESSKPRSFSGMILPSLYHMMFGLGLPEALHLNLTMLLIGRVRLLFSILSG